MAKNRAGKGRRGRGKSSHKDKGKSNQKKNLGKFRKRQKHSHTPPDYDLKGARKQAKKSKQGYVPPVKEEIRLNRYLANAGICSRREADKLIAQGDVAVNGEVTKEMGVKVKASDTVSYKGQEVSREKLVYVLLNKPKDFITTTDDPKDRKTVMDLVANACQERIYPVGRLDRNTTGLLLLTNDGHLAERLMHPSNKVKKTYEVRLDKGISPEDFQALAEGIELEDGSIRPDELYLLSEDGRELQLVIHSGRNRVIRRIFEHMGYEVERLDRTRLAGLTKKNINRGQWRYLQEAEVARLKYFQLG